MPRRSLLTAAERTDLLAFPTADDELIRHYIFSEPCPLNQIIVSWKSSLVILSSRSFLVRMQVRLVDCRFPGRLRFGPTRILDHLADYRFPGRLRFALKWILAHLVDYRFPVRLRFGLTSMSLVLHCLYLHRFAHDQLPLSPSLRWQARLIEIFLERKYFSY